MGSTGATLAAMQHVFQGARKMTEYAPGKKYKFLVLNAGLKPDSDETVVFPEGTVFTYVGRLPGINGLRRVEVDGEIWHTLLHNPEWIEEI